ncbi:transcriptional regulator family: AT-rich interaction region [Agaricus bisporus var. burnettii]|uniref:Transcriptional regulator family: AT-rich interaction region n=1 Tax=Agaricus bisporus var. burnettii TaxID=192524 RepID=A0A8H7FB67_AGABI|nr:transcriptional regulator family: AT-rich interaction region [Agaricus bisporus var. burnettii]
MLPQNVQQLRSQAQHQPQQSNMNPTGMSAGTMDHPSFFNNLDPSQAKQMAALTAANNARMATNSRPPSSMPVGNGASSGPYLGGITPAGYSSTKNDLLPAANGHANFQLPNNHGVSQTPNSAVNASFLDPPMSQPSAQAASFKQRQHQFLNGLANVMARRNTPLPPSLTGIPSPNYDPNTSPWSYIEPSNEVGSFRLAGQDVSLFKLWGLVMQHGGAQALKHNNGWFTIASEFNLPEEFPQVQANGSASVVLMLEQMYTGILFPFEDIYKKNLQEQQRKAQLASRQIPMGQPGQIRTMPANGPQQGPNQMQRGPVGTMAHTPQAPHQRAGLNAQVPQHNISLSQSTSQAGMASGSEPNLLDSDIQGIKRKLDIEDPEGKRARQKTDPLEASTGGDGSAFFNQTPGLKRTRQPLRRKIEYVPWARELDTHGGRNLRLIEHEWNTISQRRPLRDINDWGVVDIEGLRMSIRSKLPTELSYALTTVTILSTMRSQNPGSGFPIFQCPDLFDDMLDLLEEEAFGEIQDDISEDAMEVSPIVTQRDLLNAIYDEGLKPFAALEAHQGSKKLTSGFTPRPADTVLAIVNILRNLSVVSDNWQFLSHHDKMLDLLLRLCMVRRVDGSLIPVSPNLSLSDLVTIRKDTLYTLVNLVGLINFGPAYSLSQPMTRVSKRVFELVASYLVDPSEAVSPFSSIQVAGQPLNAHPKPSALTDASLEVFTRFSLSDANRQALAQTIPKPYIWELFEALVHRLPINDVDFQLFGRETWLSYLEKMVMSLYSLSFLAPPSLKQRLKSDRKLGFKTVMFRLVQKLLTNPNPDFRMLFFLCSRRAIEAMKVLDDEGDLFDTTETTTATLSFGMGFADSSESVMESGSGMLVGQRDATWDIMMTREVWSDETMFKELESLARVECH